jgi:hypothetical protein
MMEKSGEGGAPMLTVPFFFCSASRHIHLERIVVSVVVRAEVEGLGGKDAV